MNAEESETSPEPSETDRSPNLVPRIYVASLADHNAGRLHGVWLEASQPAEELHEQVTRMLSASREPLAEEWAIHDFEGFGPVAIGEYTPLDVVSRLGLGIQAHGEAFACFADAVDYDAAELDQFEQRYRGHWEALTAYVDDLLDDLGATSVLEQVPDWLQPYITIDTAAFARDLELSGDIVTGSATDGGVFIFDAQLY